MSSTQLAGPLSVAPKLGSIVPLRTKGEFDARVITKEAYVVALTPRFASDALALIREHFPTCADFDLTHLRRFVKYAYLPSYVRFYAWWFNGAYDPRWDDKPDLHNQDRTLLYLLTVPTSISKEDLLDCLVNKSTGELHEEFKFPPLVITTKVPITPPLSQSQADDMSTRFWPTVYKSSNPFGPHLSIWSRARAKVQTDAGLFMAMAEQAAEQAVGAGIGIRTGAVVVDRRADSVQILAAAGDARWMGLKPSTSDNNATRNPCCESGNVMAHAAMRAIDMVARKRARAGKRSRAPAAPTTAVEGADEAEGTEGTEGTEEMADEQKLEAESAQTAVTEPSIANPLEPTNPFHPQTDIEREAFEPLNADPDGYLCLNHEIYLTHEPCVMCSMAILHSRFGVCIFGQPMIKTGGLRAGGNMFESGSDIETVRSDSKKKIDSDDPSVWPVQGGDWLAAGGPLPTYKVPFNDHDERDGYLYEVEQEGEFKPTNYRIVYRGPNDSFLSSCFGLFWRPELNWKFLTWQWIDRFEPFDDESSKSDDVSRSSGTLSTPEDSISSTSSPPAFLPSSSFGYKPIGDCDKPGLAAGVLPFSIDPYDAISI